MALSKIVYKDFKFPYNPANTSYKIDRTYIKHKYPELAGNELEDFGSNACVISGSGEFFGDDAYLNWSKLLKEFKKKGVGRVSHPIFTDITRGLMTSLRADIEPMPDYVKYSFEIIADTEPSLNESVSIKIVSNNDKDTTTTGTNSNPKSDNGGEFVHTVVKGECLSVICSKYAKKYDTTISWKKIAEYNKMKNPNLIYPGDKIKIYYPT